MTAPLGAAAYAVVTETNSVKIIFAMMQQGETGLDAIIRIRSNPTTLKWIPVAARPEEQQASTFGPDPYVEYTLVYKDGSWTPSTDAVANFMRVMQGAQSMPATPPSALAASIAAYTRGGTAKVKAQR